MKDKYELSAGRYSLIRIRDGAGDSGSYIQAVSLNEEGTKIVYEDHIIEKGKAVICGSIYARSYSQQDWWGTTVITEFLEVDEEKQYFRFKTGNSEYELRGDL